MRFIMTPKALDNLKLSDLFFNIEKNHINHLHHRYRSAEGGPPQEEYEKALLLEAEEFLECYPICIDALTSGHGVTSEELVADFLYRL